MRAVQIHSFQPKMATLQPATRSQPIPIASRRPPAGGRLGGGAHKVSASVPNAPVIGSLPPPQMGLTMPDLALPPPSPEAFSLVRGVGCAWRAAVV